MPEDNDRERLLSSYAALLERDLQSLHEENARLRDKLGRAEAIIEKLRKSRGLFRGIR